MAPVACVQAMRMPSRTEKKQLPLNVLFFILKKG
jgi:hypothetical protein